MPTYLHCSHCYATATTNSRDFGIKDREQNLPKFVVLDSNYYSWALACIVEIACEDLL